MSLFRYNPEIHDHPEFSRGQQGYDPNQPRVPKGHSDGGQWTSGAYTNAKRDEADAKPVRLAFLPFIAAAEATINLIGMGLALLAARSQHNSRDQQAVAEFRSYKYSKDGNDPKGKINRRDVVMLSPAELEQKCRAFDVVQKLLDKAAETVNARELEEGKRLSASEYGTAVHKLIKDQIEELNRKGQNRYKLRAEVTFLKGEEKDYGTEDAIRIDVYEPRGRTICLYDPKTGEGRRNIISAERAYEIASNTIGKGYTNVIVTELRPRVKRNPPF